LFFLLYDNDLPDWIKANIKTFADNTQLRPRIISQVEDNESLQDDVCRLKEWSDKRLLKLNE